MLLKEKIDKLYNGDTKDASRFRYFLLAFDILTISYFVVSSTLPLTAWLLYVDILIGAFLLLDFMARLWIAEDRLRFTFSLGTLMDVVVIITLVVPLISQNFVFLRVVRTMRLLRSYRVLKDLRQQSSFFKQHEEVINSVVNLFVFIFIITALVYVLQVNTNADIRTYIDALYFTVTTLTTTGFGDITLHGNTGYLLSIIIMVVGVSLFLRLVQTIFRPAKVRYTCKTCGLNRHDPDAVHCKHCGEILNIETSGE
jgi:voltage-gated potassium channel